MNTTRATRTSAHEGPIRTQRRPFRRKFRRTVPLLSLPTILKKNTAKTRAAVSLSKCPPLPPPRHSATTQTHGSSSARNFDTVCVHARVYTRERTHLHRHETTFVKTLGKTKETGRETLLVVIARLVTPSRLPQTHSLPMSSVHDHTHTAGRILPSLPRTPPSPRLTPTHPAGILFVCMITIVSVGLRRSLHESRNLRIPRFSGDLCRHLHTCRNLRGSRNLRRSRNLPRRPTGSLRSATCKPGSCARSPVTPSAGRPSPWQAVK